MKSIDQFLGKLHRLEDNLRTPTAFFRHNIPHYLGIARKVAVRTLMDLIPPSEVERPKAWQVQVERLASLVTAELFLNPDRIGLLIGVSSSSAATLLEEGGVIDSIKAVTYHDIERWVKAGRNGNPLGKEITPAEAHRKDTVIASIVTKAYYGSEPGENYDRLREAIHRFVASELTANFDDLLPAVFAAWRAAFTPIFKRDFAQHLKYLTRQS